MIEVAFSKILMSIISGAGKWAFDIAKGKLIRNEQVIALLKKVGYEKLEDNFESIYAHCLVAFAAEGKPHPLLDILRDKEVISAFRESWRTGQSSVFSDQFSRIMEALSGGDDVKALGVNIRSEIESFQAMFKEFVQNTRSPSAQEIALLLDEVRDILRGPCMSPELDNLLDALYKHCYSKGMLVTRAHLFHCLLDKRLDCFRQPLLGQVERMLRELSERLESDKLAKSGYWVTDSVKELASRARSEARHLGASEVGVERLLLTLLKDPGENILNAMSKHTVTPKDIIGSITIMSPTLF